MNTDVEALVDWLMDGAPGAKGPADVIGMAGPMLIAAGIPVARVAAFVRTLHPHIMGRSFEWHRDIAGVVIREAPYALLREDVYTKSPVGWVFATGQELRRRLDGSEVLDLGELADLSARGFTDYFVMPMRFLDGQVHAVTFASDHPGGFTDGHLKALRRMSRPLARIGEILALRRTATNLLSAYVGRDAGERILQGHVQRGDTESITCVVWFSDLRGFTSMSQNQTPKDIILVLNRLFDCQVPAVEAGGGEVLKFLGDGMLAIFPIDARRPAEEAAARALQAAKEAFAALDASNAGLPKADRIAFGIALHPGEVAYGNVGGLARLDFTCIGPAVNLASRLEGLTSQVGRRLLLSEQMADLLGGGTELVGSFALKGVLEEQKVYGLI